MPNPQVNCRVPRDHHGLMRLVAERIREDPGFPEVLAGLLADMPRDPKAANGPEVMGAIRELEGRQETLERRLEALEGRQTAVKPPGGTRRLLKGAMKRSEV